MDGSVLTLIVTIAALMVGLWRLIARDVNAIRTELRDVRADVRDIRTEASADRRSLQAMMDAFRSEMLRLSERQSCIDGRGSAAG